ncbi:MAG: tetratricopeptide repeat protein [Bdellovibrionota bacterium]
MNDLTHDIREALEHAFQKQLKQRNVDLIGVIPIPSTGDRLVRLRTLEEILEEFDQSDSSRESTGYFVQIGPKRASAETELPPSLAAVAAGPAESALQASMNGAPKPAMDGIYLPNGKLNTPFLMRNAELLFESGEYTLARNVYKAVLASGEKTSSAYFGLGRCQEAEGRAEEARKHFEDSIAYHPTLEAYQRLSAILIRQNKDHEAAEVLVRAIHLKDLDASMRHDLHKAAGNCWMRAKMPSEAENHFLKALEANPSSDEVLSNLGALCLQQGKIAEARRHFQNAVAQNGRSAKALAGLGSCAMAEGAKAQAHEYFAQSLGIDLGNPTAIYYLVKCAYELKSYAKAAELLGEYIQVAPVNANLLYSLAGLQYHLGRIEDARATAERILQLQPQHAGAAELSRMIERFSASLA